MGERLPLLLHLLLLALWCRLWVCRRRSSPRRGMLLLWTLVPRTIVAPFAARRVAVTASRLWRCGVARLNLLLHIIHPDLQLSQGGQDLSVAFVLRGWGRCWDDSSHSCWLRDGLAGVRGPAKSHLPDFHECEAVVGCYLLTEGALERGIPQSRDKFLSQCDGRRHWMTKSGLTPCQPLKTPLQPIRKEVNGLSRPLLARIEATRQLMWVPPLPEGAEDPS